MRKHGKRILETVTRHTLIVIKTKTWSKPQTWCPRQCIRITPVILYAYSWPKYISFMKFTLHFTINCSFPPFDSYLKFISYMCVLRNLITSFLICIAKLHSLLNILLNFITSLSFIQILALPSVDSYPTLLPYGVSYQTLPPPDFATQFSFPHQMSYQIVFPPWDSYPVLFTSTSFLPK